jgi:hypothetical protein
VSCGSGYVVNLDDQFPVPTVAVCVVAVGKVIPLLPPQSPRRNAVPLKGAAAPAIIISLKSVSDAVIAAHVIVTDAPIVGGLKKYLYAALVTEGAVMVSLVVTVKLLFITTLFSATAPIDAKVRLLHVPKDNVFEPTVAIVDV